MLQHGNHKRLETKCWIGRQKIARVSGRGYVPANIAPCRTVIIPPASPPAALASTQL